MIFNINQNQLPATEGWGRKGEEKSKQSHSGLPEMRGGKKNHSSCFAGSPVEDGPLPETGVLRAKVSGNKEVGLGRASISTG